MGKDKLQVALVLPDSEVPEWMFLAIENIHQSDHSEISALLIPTVTRDNSLLPNSNALKYSLYRKFLKSDNTKYKLSPDAFKKRSIGASYAFPICKVDTTQKEGKLYLDIDPLITKTLSDTSILISLLNENNYLELPKLINCAIWSLNQTDGTTRKKGPPGVWEFLETKAATGIALIGRVFSFDEQLVLSSSYSSTDKFGLRRNLNNFLWKIPFMLERALRKLNHLGPEMFYQNASNNLSVSLSSERRFQYPNNWDMFVALTSNYSRRFRKKIDRLFHFEQYILLFQMGSKNTITEKFAEFKRVLPPKDRFWADPFVYEKGNTHYIFLEELIYKNKLGTIGVIKMDENGVFGEPQMVLEKDYHLSYPFLIEEDNELYMIPESSANSTIQLYKCVDFPLKWKLEEIIMNNVQALDTTVYWHNDRYWMFSNMKEHPGISGYDELFLFYSDSLVGGNWIPHPENPIVSDVRRARPAGGIFAKNGKLYRPAQNCAKRYGYGMQLLEIKKLTTTEYQEEIVQSIYPDWANDLRTTHTINHNGKLTVIDALIGRRK